MAFPLITGSFYTIQHPNIWNAQYWNDECRDWEEANWRALVADQHNVGIDTLICVVMALWSRPLFPDPEHHVGKSVKLGCEDPAMIVADEAAKRGMKVWYGLGLYGRCSEVSDYHGLDKPWPDRWFDWNRVLAEQLMQRYSDTESFAGFYLPLELSFDPDSKGTKLRDGHVELYTRWINQSLRPVIGRSALLASPAVPKLGDYSDYARQLDQLDLDVIAYQDLGGRGQAHSQDYERIKHAGQALEQLASVHRNTNVKLWANCETFSRCDPPTWRPVSFTGDMKRIEYQLKVCSPPVDKVITWIYQGVWNRRTDLVNIGPPEANTLYEQYMAYRNQQKAKSAFRNRVKHFYVGHI